MTKRTCSISECEKIAAARGICPMHYARAKKTGTLPARPTPEDRFWAKVDKSDRCWEWTGFKDRKGYGKFNGGTLGQYAHRIAWLLLVGPITEGQLMDHMCHNPGCVNPSHLRPSSNKENIENHSGPTRVNTSGVRGVHWREDAQRWQALIGHDGRRYHAGYFRDLADAEEAVVAKRNELHSRNDFDRRSELPQATTVGMGLNGTDQEPRVSADFRSN